MMPQPHTGSSGPIFPQSRIGSTGANFAQPHSGSSGTILPQTHSGSSGSIFAHFQIEQLDRKCLNRTLGQLDRSLPKRGLCKHERHSPGGEIAREARRAQQAQEEWTRRFCDRSCKACCHQSLISGPRTEFRHGTQKALARGPGRREEVCDLWQSTEPCQLPCEVRQGFVRAW